MSAENSHRPRVGVPWRTALEERDPERGPAKIRNYYESIRQAGGEPVAVSLGLNPDELKALAATLDAVVLPGSPADVDPKRYGAKAHPRTAKADVKREDTDFTLLEHALAARKPVLAICYGVQSLNVFLGGSLIQDIRSEVKTNIRHDKNGWLANLLGDRDPHHAAHLEAGYLAAIGVASPAQVNTSHHQAVLAPGRGLRVTSHAPDGVVEAVEWTGDANWVVGVQWHPERMPGDALAQKLFQALIAAARAVLVEK